MKNIAKVLTANRLADGNVVWYAHPAKWVGRVQDAYVVTTADTISVLETIAAETLSHGQYCDVVLIDVEETADGPRPLKLRERIRADGPTISLDFGSQTDRHLKVA
jgi:Protein of unknown function (DUF2849)